MDATGASGPGRSLQTPDPAREPFRSAPVSVVIPTHNRALEVQRAIQSVLAQSVLPREIIVVDDGSTDNTEAALEIFGSSVRYLRQDNAGAGAARNRGVAAATQEWVAFLDSDDVWETDHLSRIWAAVQATRGAADLYFDDLGGGFGGESETNWSTGGFAPRAPHEVVGDGAAWVLMESHPMLIPASLVRTRAFLEAGGFWEELRTAHDTHFFLKFCIGRPICAVQGVGARQADAAPGRERLMAKTGAVQEDRRRNIVRLHRDILQRNPNIAPEYRQLLKRRLAAAHRRLSRMAWERRAFGDCWKQLVQGLLLDPEFVVRRLARSFRPVSAASHHGRSRIPQQRN